jgi:mono/diheme cytochrome c family protein
MVAQRGLKIPADLHTDRLRSVPPGYIYQVIKNGYGAMGDYGDQIPVNDRWAIVAYVKALQLSRDATVNDVPADQRGELTAGNQPQTGGSRQ